jgi:urease accessory protein
VSLGTAAAEAKQAQSALLVMNKIDLAPALGADLEVLRRDAQQMCAYCPFVCTHRKRRTEVTDVIAWLTRVVFVSYLATCGAP